MQDREKKLDYIRVALTVLVVVGHASFYTSITPWGGVDIVSAMQLYHIDDTVFHHIAENFSRWIYLFHMPAFFCLSGVLLARQIDRGKWVNGYGLLKDKFKRLIIPMLLVWVGWNIPIKYISGYFSNSITGLPFIKHALVQIIFPTNVYLWFLQALFVGSILLYYIKKINSLKAQFIVSVVLWRLHYVILARVGSPYQMCGGAFQYVIWLWLGSVIEKMIPRSKPGKRICLLLTVILSATYQLLPSGKLEMYFIGLVIPFSFILSLWIIAEMVSNRQSKIGNGVLFKTILNYSFDIYLFAEPINFLILHWFLKEGRLGILGSEGGSASVYF